MSVNYQTLDNIESMTTLINKTELFIKSISVQEVKGSVEEYNLLHIQAIYVSGIEKGYLTNKDIEQINRLFASHHNAENNDIWKFLDVSNLEFEKSDSSRIELSFTVKYSEYAKKNNWD